MAFGGSDDFADMQATALANHLGKVSLSGSSNMAGRARDGHAVKYHLRDLEIQQTIGEDQRLSVLVTYFMDMHAAGVGQKP